MYYYLNVISTLNKHSLCFTNLRSRRTLHQNRTRSPYLDSLSSSLPLANQNSWWRTNLGNANLVVVATYHHVCNIFFRFKLGKYFSVTYLQFTASSSGDKSPSELTAVCIKGMFEFFVINGLSSETSILPRVAANVLTGSSFGVLLFKLSSSSKQF